jgi:hypothetical protein
VRGKLLSPSGETLREFELPRGAEGRYASVVHVDSPQLWTAETPSLYRLQLTLSANGQPLQTLEERVGLREISIVDGVLKLNGRPIKLRGVDRHDEAPDVGRATRTANWQKDLQLMKQGNINFVRTSHSPPNEGFIAACDEAGIYVLCEVPLAHFQSSLKNDPAYRANVMARVEQTLGRDKNHPSVIAWSIGNENNVQDLLFEAGKHAKEVDPSRPICYPTHGTNGQDGILYADRTPQTDFWETRKVYAPVQFVETTAAVKPGPQEIALTVENRYDFRSLAGIKLAWTLERNGTAAEKGELPLRAPSHDRETLRIPLTIPTDTGADMLALNVRCLDEKGMAINERAVRLDLPGGPSDSWLTAAPAVAAKVTQGPDDVRLDQGTWVLAVSRNTGAATITDKAGRVLVAGILPHAGRKLTDPERGRVKRLDMWPTSTLDKAEDVQVKVSQGPDGVKLEVSGRYPRPGAPEQSCIGGYVAEITTHGAMTIHYSYTPTAAKGSLAEAGLSVVVPRATEFRWIGQGPYCGYPGKDRLNDFGLFHLNRDDLRFQGNRRHTRVALLTTPTGAGVALLTEAADVAVERDDDQTLLSANALISGLGEKGRTPETLIDAAKTEKISGAFTLLPLQEAWPETLVRWFGKPAAAAEVYRPFYHSYDQ